MPRRTVSVKVRYQVRVTRRVRRTVSYRWQPSVSALDDSNDDLVEAATWAINAARLRGDDPFSQPARVQLLADTRARLARAVDEDEIAEVIDDVLNHAEEE